MSRYAVMILNELQLILNSFWVEMISVETNLPPIWREYMAHVLRGPIWVMKRHDRTDCVI